MKLNTPGAPVRPEPGRYTYFDRESGIGIIGYGSTLERALETAAEATFALVADLAQVRAERTLPVSFVESDPARAVTRWLSQLLDASRVHGIVFSEFHVQREHDRWWGCATGERWHRPGGRSIEVRDDATVQRTPRGWEASCLVRCVPRLPSPVQAPVPETLEASEDGD